MVLKMKTKDIINKAKEMQFKEKITWVVIFSLIIIVLVQTIVIFSLGTNRVHRISIPPSIEFGAMVDTDTINPFEIYQIAGAITQQLYLWQDGEQDFKKNINKFNAFITPAYRQYLLAEYNNLLKIGQLKGRERSLQPVNIYKESSVQKNNDGEWTVAIDFQHQEHIDNQRFKDFVIRHLIRVVYRQIDGESNPWGLQLDVPTIKPLRLK